MREPLSNVGRVCSGHVPKPDPKLHILPSVDFVGKHVKLGFPTDCLSVEMEHMWVLVMSVDGDEKMSGVLANDPLHINDVECGSPVLFDKTEIEAILPSEWEGPRG